MADMICHKVYELLMSILIIYMIQIFHTLAYANTIRNSVTGPFGSPIFK
jgi:hypothetical protein